MKMLSAKLFLAGFICFGSVGVRGIVSKGSAAGVAEEKKNAEKGDNAGEESISRDYNIAGYNDAYGHEGYGLSSHASYGLPEEHGYGVHEGHDFHVHHIDTYQHHHGDHHKHHDYNYHKALALKGLLVPLAGVALLGAAAAFVSNPILLQLGVISGTSLGRRKRNAMKNPEETRGRKISEDQIRLNEIKLLEKFMAKVPREDVKLQNKKMFADFLSCSGVTSRDDCLERVACELHSPEGASMPMEVNVMSIVVNEILRNDFISEAVKNSLLEAVKKGEQNLGCTFYRCNQMGKGERFSAL